MQWDTSSSIRLSESGCGGAKVLDEFEERFLTFIGRFMIEPEQCVHLPLEVMTVRNRSITFRFLELAAPCTLCCKCHMRSFPSASSQCSPILPSRRTCPSH